MIRSETQAQNLEFIGKRILVVEDDFLLAADLCCALRDLGATVLGPAPTSFYALSLLGRRGVDAAVLDIRLYGKDDFEVAEELRTRRIPMVFATARSAEEIPVKFRSEPRLSKPYHMTGLVSLVGELLKSPVMPLASTILPIRDKPLGWETRLVLAVAGSLRLP